jgi:DNA recombination protein RmuC
MLVLFASHIPEFPMLELLAAILVLLIAAIVLLVVLLRKKTIIDIAQLKPSFDCIEKSNERVERVVREEISKNRDESNSAARQNRDEIARTLKDFNDSLIKSMSETSTAQSRNSSDMLEQITKLIDSTEKKLESQKAVIDEKLRQVQLDNSNSARQLREDVGASMKSVNDSVMIGMKGMSDTQQKQMEALGGQFSKLTDTNQLGFDSLKTSVEQKLKSMQEDNAKQLEQMRQTVDEKLQGTLEKRLGESFKQVSERLEAVHKGLGEMQTLATGVGDLKKVLSNVKTRGTWGEVQLGAMLEQALHPDQYEKNVATKEGSERVEFAIKLPGQSGNAEECVWLPIDAKFPVEDFQRFLDAHDSADAEAAECAGKLLETRIKACAIDIRDKYLNPPRTTDFAVLFLPIEGLFAEVIRRTALVEMLQRDCRIMVAGPTTLWSLLSSLQMGFRTLAIQKRSSEVWNLLAAVKTEWGKYGDILKKVQRQLIAASNTIDEVGIRSRAIDRKLKDVEALPTGDSAAVLRFENTLADDEILDGKIE